MPDERPPFIGWLILGALLVLQTLLDLPGWLADGLYQGPWKEATFTQGILGLAGIWMVYVSWYRWHFGRRGLLPTTDLWRAPRRSVPQVLCVGAVLVIGGMLAGRLPEGVAPGPAPMLLILAGSLVLLVGGYAGLVLLGPLAEGGSSDE